MNFLNTHILALLIFFPLLSALLLTALPTHKTNTIKLTALLFFLVECILSLHIVFHFTNTGVTDQFYAEVSWIPSWNIFFRVGIDGVSQLLIVFVASVLPLALLGTWKSIDKSAKAALICLMIIEGSLIGVFCALDLVFFFVCFEVVLVPLFFLVSLGSNKNALPFLITELLGAAFLLAGIVLTATHCDHSFNLLQLVEYRLPHSLQLIAFCLFAVSLTVRIPLFPWHTRSSNVHAEAPAIVSIVLLSLSLATGIYGFFRVVLPLFPDAAQALQPWLMGLSVFGTLYGAIISLAQKNLKRWIASLNFSLAGIAALGIFTLNLTGITGGIFQTLNLIIVMCGLFLLLGMMEEHTPPLLVFFFIVLSLAAVAMPSTNMFASGFLILTGASRVSPLVIYVSATGWVVLVVSVLQVVHHLHRRAQTPPTKHQHDLSQREMIVMFFLMACIFGLGLCPKFILPKIERSAETLLLIMDGERQGP